MEYVAKKLKAGKTELDLLEILAEGSPEAAYQFSQVLKISKRLKPPANCILSVMKDLHKILNHDAFSPGLKEFQMAFSDLLDVDEVLRIQLGLLTKKKPAPLELPRDPVDWKEALFNLRWLVNRILEIAALIVQDLDPLVLHPHLKTLTPLRLDALLAADPAPLSAASDLCRAIIAHLEPLIIFRSNHSKPVKLTPEIEQAIIRQREALFLTVDYGTSDEEEEEEEEEEEVVVVEEEVVEEDSSSEDYPPDPGPRPEPGIDGRAARLAEWERAYAAFKAGNSNRMARKAPKKAPQVEEEPDDRLSIDLRGPRVPRDTRPPVTPPAPKKEPEPEPEPEPEAQAEAEAEGEVAEGEAKAAPEEAEDLAPAVVLPEAVVVPVSGKQRRRSSTTRRKSSPRVQPVPPLPIPVLPDPVPSRRNSDVPSSRKSSVSSVPRPVEPDGHWDSSEEEVLLPPVDLEPEPESEPEPEPEQEEEEEAAPEPPPPPPPPPPRLAPVYTAPKITFKPKSPPKPMTPNRCEVHTPTHGWKLGRWEDTRPPTPPRKGLTAQEFLEQAENAAMRKAKASKAKARVILSTHKVPFGQQKTPSDLPLVPGLSLLFSPGPSPSRKKPARRHGPAPLTMTELNFFSPSTPGASVLRVAGEEHRPVLDLKARSPRPGGGSFRNASPPSDTAPLVRNMKGGWIEHRGILQEHPSTPGHDSPENSGRSSSVDSARAQTSPHMQGSLAYRRRFAPKLDPLAAQTGSAHDLRTLLSTPGVNALVRTPLSAAASLSVPSLPSLGHANKGLLSPGPRNLTSSGSRRSPPPPINPPHPGASPPHPTHTHLDASSPSTFLNRARTNIVQFLGAHHLEALSTPKALTPHAAASPRRSFGVSSTPRGAASPRRSFGYSAPGTRLVASPFPANDAPLTVSGEIPQSTATSPASSRAPSRRGSDLSHASPPPDALSRSNSGTPIGPEASHVTSAAVSLTDDDALEQWKPSPTASPMGGWNGSLWGTDAVEAELGKVKDAGKGGRSPDKQTTRSAFRDSPSPSHQLPPPPKVRVGAGQGDRPLARAKDSPVSTPGGQRLTTPAKTPETRPNIAPTFPDGPRSRSRSPEGTPSMRAAKPSRSPLANRPAFNPDVASSPTNNRSPTRMSSGWARGSPPPSSELDPPRPFDRFPSSGSASDLFGGGRGGHPHPTIDIPSPLPPSPTRGTNRGMKSALNKMVMSGLRNINTEMSSPLASSPSGHL